MYCVRKHFCSYSLQASSTAEILKNHVNDCFKINGKQVIKMPKNNEYIRFENYEKKKKSQFMMYADVCMPILIIVCSKKVNTVPMWWKNVLTKNL